MPGLPMALVTPLLGRRASVLHECSVASRPHHADQQKRSDVRRPDELGTRIDIEQHDFIANAGVM